MPEENLPDLAKLENEINSNLKELHELERRVLQDAAFSSTFRVHTCPTCKVKAVDLQGRNCPTGWKRVEIVRGTVDYYCGTCTPGAESLADYNRRTRSQMGM